jgi:hypothetical protein
MSDTNAEPEKKIYRQRPKPVGFELEYSLDGDTLVIDSMRKIDRVPLKYVEAVRFLYAPANTARGGFRTVLTLRDGKKLSFGNLSWRSLVDCQNQSEDYRAFVERLVEAIRRANPKVRFIGGRSPVGWWLSLILGVATTLGLIYFIARTFTMGANGAAGLGVAVLALTLWQIAPFVRRNRPQALASGTIPPELMP